MERSNWDAQARVAFRDAREPQALAAAVVRFHKRVDEVVEQTIQGHAVKLACAKGCSYCCSLRVEVTPHETFALAGWLKRRFPADRLAAVTTKLRANVEATRAMGAEQRKRTNVACALLGNDGACTAYEARPAQCRRFQSVDVQVCKASYADPANDSIASPNHPAIAHNASVIVTQTNAALAEAGLDATTADMNFALLEALENPKAWRRWRDGKKAFVAF
ncbi:MAG TPA: YkgJ family cysteine cluster protein [Usitatibacter sp.]|nr:YkgJ family cysteine cluster protein [Usitatibacter sp.]